MCRVRRLWKCEHGWLSKYVSATDADEIRVICLDHGCEMQEVVADDEHCGVLAPVALNGDTGRCLRNRGHDGLHKYASDHTVLRWPDDGDGMRGLEASDRRNTLTIADDGTYRMTHHGEGVGRSVESMKLDVI